MRPDGRAADAIRPVSVELEVNPQAEGSCLFSIGHTRVWCTASVIDELPGWRRASQKGWVTAEYRMLPRATDTRGEREGRHDKKGRTAEIERLVARALRGAVDLAALGPRQVIVDCDVLQADGGTRCASITGGWIALARALERLARQGKLARSPLITGVAAVSAGIVGGEAVVDLAYAEDARAEVDLNLVMTSSGRVVEIQGTAEAEPFDRRQLDAMLTLAEGGITELLRVQAAAVAP